MAAGAGGRPLSAHRESAAALAVCTAVAVLLNVKLLREEVFSQDAFVHQYWMWHFRDAALFNDGLTHDLRESARYPVGYQGLFWLAAQVASPITFGEWLGVGLMAISGWLVFLIVREHTAWPPAAWIAAALFLALTDIHRFPGGFQRAFVHPIVLLTVLLALKGRLLPAALVAAAGALVYPPASLLALGALGLSALGWSGGRPRIEPRRAAFAALAAVLAAIAVLLPGLLSGGTPDVLTAAEARRYPDFGQHGVLRFFVPSLLDFLRQNRSGFDLQISGSILILAVAAALALRPANARLLRREVLVLPVVALGAFAVAHAVLFRLYLPHRYTYPLVAFAAIAVAVALAPSWTALLAARRARLLAFAVLCGPGLLYVLAAYAFPLGPLEPLDELGTPVVAGIAVAVVAVAAALALRLTRLPAARAAQIGAVVTGVGLVAAMGASGYKARGQPCAKRAAVGYLASLPKDAVIAGDPRDLECLPGTTRRAVVISTQLAPSYEPTYFHRGRKRMFDMLRAYYGPSPEAIGPLRTRYGATVLWVRRDALRREIAGKTDRWPAARLPFGRYVDRLLRSGTPATLSLPRACRRFAKGAEEVYDIACVAAMTRAAG